MKKFVYALLVILFISSPFLHAGRGGSAFGGALAGSMIGSVVGSAATRDSGSARRAEAEARRAQDQTASLRHEQALRRDVAGSRSTQVTQMAMFFGLIVLLLAVFGLAVMLFRRRR